MQSVIEAARDTQSRSNGSFLLVIAELAHEGWVGGELFVPQERHCVVPLVWHPGNAATLPMTGEKKSCMLCGSWSKVPFLSVATITIGIKDQLWRDTGWAVQRMARHWVGVKVSLVDLIPSSLYCFPPCVSLKHVWQQSFLLNSFHLTQVSG